MLRCQQSVVELQCQRVGAGAKTRALVERDALRRGPDDKKLQLLVPRPLHRALQQLGADAPAPQIRLRIQVGDIAIPVVESVAFYEQPDGPVPARKRAYPEFAE